MRCSQVYKRAPCYNEQSTMILIIVYDIGQYSLLGSTLRP